MRYAERMRKLRKEKGYNQTHIAKVIRVAQTTYSDYENGNVRIPIEHIVELARLYNVSLNFMLGVSDIRNTFPQK